MKKAFFVSLIPLLLCGCGGKGQGNPYSYSDAASYSEYKEPLTFTESITGFDIDYPVGEVIVKTGETFRVEETLISGDYLPLYHFLDGSNLRVRFCKDGTVYNRLSKRLTVTIPGDLDTLQIATISAKYNVDAKGIKILQCNSTSGSGHVKLTSLQNGSFRSISGSIAGTIGKAGSLAFDTTSGASSIACDSLERFRHDAISGSSELTVADSSALEKVEIDVTSGGATLHLDGKKGIDLHFKSSTGRKSLEFTEGSDPSLGKFDLTFSSISGSLYVKKIA